MNSSKMLSILWPKMFAGTFAQWQEEFERLVRGKKLNVIFTPNPEQIVLAKNNLDFWQAFQTADVYLPDGVGVIIAQRWLKLLGREAPQLQQKIGGRSVVEWWLKRGGPEKTLLVGARGDVAQKTATRFDLQEEWLKGVTGLSSVANALSESPSLKSQEELQQLQEFIIKWKPAVIFVAFGAPWQELWISRNTEWLAQADVKVVMVCGGAFDVLSGTVSAPPKLFEVLGLEWLWRLLSEPWRWKRQLRGARFFGDVFFGR